MEEFIKIDEKKLRFPSREFHIFLFFFLVPSFR